MNCWDFGMKQESILVGRSCNMASSSTGNEGRPVTRHDILKLMKAREEIDAQIVALGGILESVSR